MNIRLYGRLAEAIGPEIQVHASGHCSIAELRERIAAEHPDAAPIIASRRARACVGSVLVPDDHVVSAGERVEFLPPVSGG